MNIFAIENKIPHNLLIDILSENFDSH